MFYCQFNFFAYRRFLLDSSQFGFYNQNGTVVNFVERPIYREDAIGLKTLDKKGKLKIVTAPGVSHFMWHLNVSVFDNYIIPYLD